jgi:hypothetical protein
MPTGVMMRGGGGIALVIGGQAGRKERVTKRTNIVPEEILEQDVDANI